MTEKAIINAQIELANSAIFNADDLTVIKDFSDGHKACLNANKSCVAIFADFEDGKLFRVSPWNRIQEKDAMQIAINLYS